MKLRLHHIEMCVKDPVPVVKLLCDQLGLNLLGHRETDNCLQYVLKLSKALFVVTTRKGVAYYGRHNNNANLLKNENEILPKEKKLPLDTCDDWSLFCCKEDKGEDHIDSVFNVALEVKNLEESVKWVKESGATVLQDICRVEGAEGHVDYAIVKSCCGNVVHTMIQKTDFDGWFLPGFNKLPESWACRDPNNESHINGITMSHFDHFTLVGRVGESNEIIKWYEATFGMKRFLTNRQDTEEDGLVIGNDIGMRLKVMEFWKCSEAGLSSQTCEEENWEPLKIVIGESLPNISNTQIESFIHDHGGPGIQHVGLHTENMFETVRELTRTGVRFRHPPPTYYTEVGQLNVIHAVGEDLELLRKYGILLDNEADVFDEDDDSTEEKYLMQVFTHPVFDQDTFFLEVIQRKGARGFGVGNVTALARSVNAYKEMLEKQKLADAELSQKSNRFINENDAIEILQEN